jgi:carboxypeptidase Taq
MSGQMQALKIRLGTLADLDGASELAVWDQQCKMPTDGGQARADVLATLASLRHGLFTDDETGRLLDAAGSDLDGADRDGDEARLLEVTRRRWEKSKRVPTELEGELARASSEGQEAWVAARAASDFESFAPYLERILELTRRYVDCHLGHDGFECAYDVLIDDYEPGIKTARVADLFAQLKGELVPMIATLARATPVDERPLRAHFAQDGQRRLAREIVGLMGFDEQGWRMDDTVHPFAVGIGPGDVRITTRWDESYWPMALYGAMHECGHGLYEAGIAPELRRTPIGTAQSLGVHESQSRLWENMVGRSRAFSQTLAPRLARCAGGELADIEPEELYRAINRVKPSFIRVEADEATYGLHIILRFELEQELIEGRLGVADLPQAWNARVHEYFGLEVTDDADGVLQDVHWSGGMLGYFPTYALGNLIAGQLWERAQAQITGLDGELAAGELAPLREWLRLRVHRHGAKFGTEELLEREGGGPISVAPFVRYLKAKLSDVYGVDLGD